MPIALLDSEQADRDLTSQVTVLTHTPSASDHLQCQGCVKFGNGSKDLDGSGGTFEFTVTVGGQTIEPDPQEIEFSTAVRVTKSTVPFPVPANSEVIIKIKSPNAGDSDVNVTAYLYDVSDINFTGSGLVAVNADTLDDEGDDMYFETAGGIGIANAEIRAYVASEYTTSGSNATIRARTRTGDDGGWVDDLMLNSGVAYTIWVYKQGEYGPDTTDVTPS